MALMLCYGMLQDFFLLSIHIFDNFAITSIYKYMQEKQPFLCMSAFVGMHQYNFHSRRQDERTK